MKDYHLIVSNPPHGEVNLAGAVECFRLSRAEVEMKANYALPEIWFASPERQRLEATFQTLLAAGLRVVLVSGEAVRSLPEPAHVRGFSFGEQDLSIQVDGRDIALSYQAPITGVACRPLRVSDALSRSSRGTALGRLSHTGLTPDSLVGRAERRRENVRSDAYDPELSPFVDLFWQEETEVVRASFLETSVAQGKPAVADLNALASELEQRFAHAHFDRRGLGMRVRRRVMVGEYPDEERRKGFSYATRALSQLLEEISPDLKRIAYVELASRLVYLTIRAGSGG